MKFVCLYYKSGKWQKEQNRVVISAEHSMLLRKSFICSLKFPYALPIVGALNSYHSALSPHLKHIQNEVLQVRSSSISSPTTLTLLGLLTFTYSLTQRKYSVSSHWNLMLPWVLAPILSTLLVISVGFFFGICYFISFSTSII